ncbi:MAG: GIY-YIG nuclease family protein [Chitinophagaceae bacterium]|nr:GIY-YIG nuclease family protein [Chitinophagaceae bacterium]MCW5929658.1 GIY-YIG nuclease family protein [Chitinophagaceae bacterium]
MAYYAYIIRSLTDGSFYKGYSENPLQRLAQHNNKLSHYTAAKVPWQLVYIELCASKTIALQREKALKKYSHSQIEQLIASQKNIVKQFLQ